MPQSRRFLSATLATLAVAAVPAMASPKDDLAFTVQEFNKDKTSGWIIERLVTLELPDKCFGKVADKSSAAFAKVASIARYIERYAKAVTGDEWTKLEHQSANTPEANRTLVDKMVADFKPKFHLTVHLEADDCGATGHDLWINYMTSSVLAAVSFPPKSGKLTITVNVVPKVKTLTAEVNKDGTALTVTAPRDVEPVAWDRTIESALKRVSTKN